MLKQKIAFFVLLILVLAVLGIALGTLPANASSSYGLDETMGVADNTGTVKEKLVKDDPEVVAGKMVGTLLTWSGVVFLVLIFMGGLTWMMAQGNEQQVEKAKQMIIAAVFGLLVVLAAYAITAYIGKTLVG